MRCFLIALIGSLAACQSAPPPDRLGEQRVIEKLTPLATRVEPLMVLPGARVHITAMLSDPLYEADLRVQVLRCPKIDKNTRDIQCLATHSEEVLAEGTPTRSDEILVFEFDYDLPPEIVPPEAVTGDIQDVYRLLEGVENIMFRTISASDHVTQVGRISVVSEMFPESEFEFEPPPLEDPKITDPDATLLTPDHEPVTLDETKVNELAPGDYTFYGFGGHQFFCTPGCLLVPPKEYFDLPRLRLEPGTSPRYYLIGFQGEVRRFVIQVLER